MERPIIENALRLAEQTTRIILDNSYRSSTGSYGIHDVLLFGSTLERDGHDLDLLVIHNLRLLRDFGIVTKYDREEGKPLPDLSAKADKISSELILEAMGSKCFEDLLEALDRLNDIYRAEMEEFEHNRDPIHNPTNPIYTLDFPYIGRTELDFSRANLVTAYEILGRKIQEGMTVTKVEGLFKQRNLSLDTLDLQIMHESIFEDRETRDIVVKQCRDPKFWYDVLTKGRLYDTETGKFSKSFEDKYPGKAELFRV